MVSSYYTQLKSITVAADAEQANIKVGTRNAELKTFVFSSAFRVSASVFYPAPAAWSLTG
jgi:hypothetical protein